VSILFEVFHKQNSWASLVSRFPDAAARNAGLSQRDPFVVRAARSLLLLRGSLLIPKASSSEV
jgi:hypothetical protein